MPAVSTASVPLGTYGTSILSPSAFAPVVSLTKNILSIKMNLRAKFGLDCTAVWPPIRNIYTHPYMHNKFYVLRYHQECINDINLSLNVLFFFSQ